MKKILPLIIIVVLVFLMARGWWGSQLSAVNPEDNNTQIVIIPNGAGVSEIADQLKKENLIKSTLVFNLYIRQQGVAESLQAGTFKISPSMTTEQIVDVLKGGASEIWVTLLEGWRVEEMAEKLNADLGIKSDEFISELENEDFKQSFQTSFIKLSKEGYMFPDTYLIPKELSVKQIAQLMRGTFEQRYSDELRSKIKAKGLTEDEGVILASIVEREARSQKARTEVASILLKRLNMEMGLNADATIQYALGYQKNEKSWWKRHLTKDDLKIDSAYNTYIHRGLPPTPICNPSLSSLNAVANANPNTPYLYYYHDSKGNSHYARTLDEHNENVANNP